MAEANIFGTHRGRRNWTPRKRVRSDNHTRRNLWNKQNIIIDTGSELSFISTRKYNKLNNIFCTTYNELLKKIEQHTRDQGFAGPITSCWSKGNNQTVEHEIYLLPVQGLTINGATGKVNKTARRQAMIDINIKGEIIPLTFIIFSDVTADMLVGCDHLKGLNSVIDCKQ